MGSGYDWRNFKNNPKGLGGSNPNVGYLHQALFKGAINSSEFQAGMEANRVGPLSMSERASVLPMSNRVGYNPLNIQPFTSNPSGFSLFNQRKQLLSTPQTWNSAATPYTQSMSSFSQLNGEGFQYRPKSPAWGPGIDQWQRFARPAGSWGNAYNNTVMPEFGGGGSGGGGKPPTTFAGFGGADDGFYKGVRPNYKPGAYSTLPNVSAPQSGFNLRNTLGSPTAAGVLGGLAYGYSLIDRIGQDPTMVSNVVFPGVVGGVVSKTLQSQFVAPTLSKLGAENAFGLYRAGEGAAQRTFFNGAKAGIKLPGLGPLLVGFDAWNSVGQAGSADPTRAQLGRTNLAYSGGYLASAGAASLAGLTGIPGLGIGIAGAAMLGGAANELMQPSQYEKNTAASINNLNSSQKAFSYGVSPNLPTKLNSFQAAATGVSLYLDTFMAGGAMVYDLPAKALGAPTASSVRSQFGKMSVDASSLTGQFKGMTFGQAKSAYIGSTLAPNVLVPGGTTTYADTIDYKGGIPTFVKEQLSSMYREGKALNMSEGQIKRASIQAGATTYAALAQRANHEQKVIDNMTRSAGRGLFGEYKPMAYKNNNAVQNSVQAALNKVGSTVHGVANWLTGPLSSALAVPGIQEKAWKRQQTISGMNYAASFLAGQGVKPTAMIAGATPQALKAAFSGGGSASGGSGGGYDNSWQVKAEARYRKGEQERAARERSNLSEAGYRYEAAQKADLPQFNFNYHALDGGAPHVSRGLGAAIRHRETRFQEQLSEGRSWLMDQDKRYGELLKTESRIKADKTLNPVDKIQALTSNEYQKQNVNESINQFVTKLKDASRALADTKQELSDSSRYQSEQQAENLTRANYMRRRDARNDRKARLLDRKSMGLMSERSYIKATFEDAREDFADANNQYYAQYKRESADYDIGVASYKERTGKDFDPKGTYKIGEDGYDLQETFRGLGYFAEFRREFQQRGEKETSQSAQAFAMRLSRQKQIQRGLQPYATSFFGTLGRGGSFGDAIKSLQLPFMQDVGNLAVKGLSGLITNFIEGPMAPTGNQSFTNTSGQAVQQQAVIEQKVTEVIAGQVAGGAAPVMGVQSATGGMSGGLANAGLLAGIGGLFKGTGGIAGMAGRFFGKSGTTSIAATLAAKGGTLGKLAGNFQKAGGMGFGSLAAFGNLAGGLIGGIGGSMVGNALAPNHYGSTGGSIGSTVGGTAGAIIGQALIPIPFVGAAIGGFLGSLLGGGIGGFFGGGSSKKAMKEQQAAQELHQKTMTVFAPKVKGIMADIDPLDWSSIEGAKNRLRKTNVRGREQTSIRRAAYNDIAKMKEALLPYRDLSDRPGGIAGNLFENKVRAGMSLASYGPFSDAPASKLYEFYSGIQERLAELKPEQRSQYKQLSQEALGAQRSYLDTQLNLQISRSQSQYGFDVRGAAIESLSRGVAFDQMQRQVNNFDRDSQRSLEQIMGVTQRRGNRSKIAAEMLDERGFQKGILGRNFDILQQSQSLQSDQSSFNLSTALQDINFLTESQKNLATEANKLTPIIGDVNDELLRLLSAIKDVSDALKKI